MENTSPKKTCINHKDVEAPYYCEACKAPLCKTCVIIFDGSIYYCPQCASANEGKLSPKRKKMIMASYGAVAAATICFLIFYYVAAFYGNENIYSVITTIIGFLILVLSIIGAALGFSAKRRNSKNPISVWIAILWSLVILIIYLLLCVIGLSLQN